MNIYLVPYTWARHIVVSLGIGGATLVWWWMMITMIIQAGPWFWDKGLYWAQGTEGTLWLAGMSMCAAGGSVLSEGSLRRRSLLWRLAYAGAAGLMAFGLTAAMMLVASFAAPYLGSESRRLLLQDASLVTLRYRLFTWASMGISAGVSAFAMRGLQRLLGRAFSLGLDGGKALPARSRAQWSMDLFFHLAGGFVAAWSASAVWHVCGHYDALFGDLYVAAAASSLVFGLGFGLLVWPIPDELYTGWMRVLSVERYGLRIPLDHVDGRVAERFLGHFPRGLDLYMPADRGVAELHTSFVVDANKRYAVRGLSVKPTVVKRFLERVDLRYDPRRPAPLETELSMEDRIVLGEPGQPQTEMEFLLLPKEEQ